MTIKIAVLKERQAHEARVAATPDTVKRLIGLGFEVVVEKDAGAGASLPDAAYEAAGARLAADAGAALQGAGIALKVQPPARGGEGMADELASFEKGTILIAILDALGDRKGIDAIAAATGRLPPVRARRRDIRAPPPGCSTGSESTPPRRSRETAGSAGWPCTPSRSAHEA